MAAAVRLLAERHRVIAEGAGATPVAAALAGVPEARKVVCVVSGGNLDAAKLCAILEGRLPWDIVPIRHWGLTPELLIMGSDPRTFLTRKPRGSRDRRRSHGLARLRPK